MTLIIALLVLWVVLAIVGVTIKGLFWLTILAVLLFLLTGALHFGRRGRY